MRDVFHPEALSEYTEAVQYYTEQKVEAAQAFINAISSDETMRNTQVDLGLPLHSIFQCHMDGKPYES